MGEQYWEYFEDPDIAGPRSKQQPLQAIEWTWRCGDCNTSWVDHLALRHDPELGLGWSEEALWLLPEESLREKAGYWGLVVGNTPRDQLVAEMLDYQYRPWTRDLLERAALDALLSVAEGFDLPTTGCDRSQLTSLILEAQERE